MAGARRAELPAGWQCGVRHHPTRTHSAIHHHRPRSTSHSPTARNVGAQVEEVPETAFADWIAGDHKSEACSSLVEVGGAARGRELARDAP
eukprot:5402265-Prymnesium_polylepis.1